MSRTPAPSPIEDVASTDIIVPFIEQIIASRIQTNGQRNPEDTPTLVYTLLREVPSEPPLGGPPRFQFIWSDDASTNTTAGTRSTPSEIWIDSDRLREYLQRFQCAAISWKPADILEVTLIPENGRLPSGAAETTRYEFVTIEKLHQMIHSRSHSRPRSRSRSQSHSRSSAHSNDMSGNGSNETVASSSLHESLASMDSTMTTTTTTSSATDYDDEEDDEEEDEVDMYESPAASAIAARMRNSSSYGSDCHPSSSSSGSSTQFRFPHLPHQGIHQFNLFLPPVYALGQLIGQGEFSKVFLAVNIETEGIYAVKIFRQRLCAIVTEQIVREVETLKGLDCPNVLKVVETILYGDNTFMVMELMRKGDLRVYINKHGHQSEPQARRFFMDLLNGVNYIHRRNIVHLDLKLENLLLDDDLNLKITDFGCARLQVGQKLFNHPCGSYAYGAPEVISGEEFDGRKADTWSMGVILYCLLMARLPYCDKEHDVSKMLCERKEAPPVKYPLTVTCKDLLARLLTFCKEKRAHTQEIMCHHWLHHQQLPDL